MCVVLSSVRHGLCDASVVSEKTRGGDAAAAKETETYVGVVREKDSKKPRLPHTARQEVPKRNAGTAGSVVKEPSSNGPPTTTRTTNDGTGDEGEMANTSVSCRCHV